MMKFDQIFIFILGGLSIYLVGSNDKKTRKYGYIFGLLSQPFWIYSAYINNQNGILFLSLWYTYSWGRGIYKHW